MGRGVGQTFLQRRTKINDQQVHEKVHNVIKEIKVKTTMRYHLTPVRKAIIKKTSNSMVIIVEDMEKNEHLCTVEGEVNWKQCGAFSKN